MHDSMYKAVLDNIKKIKNEGIVFVEPKREEGKAKFPNISRYNPSNFKGNI